MSQGDWDISDSDHEHTFKLDRAFDFTGVAAVYTIHVHGEGGKPLFWIKSSGESWVAENVTEAACVFVKAVAEMVGAMPCAKCNELADERDALLRGLEAARADIADLRSAAPPAVSAPSDTMTEADALWLKGICGEAGVIDTRHSVLPRIIATYYALRRVTEHRDDLMDNAGELYDELVATRAERDSPKPVAAPQGAVSAPSEPVAWHLMYGEDGACIKGLGNCFPTREKGQHLVDELNRNPASKGRYRLRPLYAAFAWPSIRDAINEVAVAIDKPTTLAPAPHPAVSAEDIAWLEQLARMEPYAEHIRASRILAALHPTTPASEGEKDD